METQEADSGVVMGPTEDRREERVEELDCLAAGDEDDELVVLRKLNRGHVGAEASSANHIAANSTQVKKLYLAFVQYERGQTHQSDLTGNYRHKLLQSLWNSKAV